ncbi:MAG: hypothetical protein ACW98J_10705, partial [Candidatus Thorarchaeota archaeon]
ETMKEFWTEQNIEPPPKLIFPFSDSDVSEIFANSEGVPRDAIRNAISKLDSILFEKEEEEVEEQPDYVVKLTPTVVISSMIKAFELAGSDGGVEVSLDDEATAATKESTSVLTLTKGPISRKVGIDVPGVKDWDRSGGVASFYSARRLQKLIEAGEINMAMMAVPEATAGAKFEAVIEDLGPNLADLRFTETTATAFIEAIAKGRLPDATAELFTGFLERII